MSGKRDRKGNVIFFLFFKKIEIYFTYRKTHSYFYKCKQPRKRPHKYSIEQHPENSPAPLCRPNAPPRPGPWRPLICFLSWQFCLFQMSYKWNHVA